MTPDTLTEALRARLGDQAPPHDDPAAWLGRLEAQADRDWRWEDEVVRVGDWIDAAAATPRGATLVSWDDWTVTWDRRDPNGGMATRCRSLRRSDPIGRRSLVRRARALKSVGLPVHLDHIDGRTVLRTAGAGLEADADGPDRAPGVLIGKLLVELIELARRGMVPRELATALLSTARGPRIIPLSVRDEGFSEAMRSLCRWVPAAGTAWFPLTSAWSSLPPATPEEADTTVRRHLAAHLTSLHHRLMGREVLGSQRGRKAQLLDAVRALRTAAPPPLATGAVGVDLEGRILVVHCDGMAIRWGPRDAGHNLLLGPEGLDPRETRRLLRTRAAAPVNPRLDQEVGGDTEAVDALCRWLATAARLRTLRMMLERTS